MRMTFAPGWTQEIRPENERYDLMCYITDTFKALNGFRPRYDHNEDTIEDLRAMAVSYTHLTLPTNREV